LGDFNEIFSICGQLHAGLRIKIWVNSLKGLRIYGGLKLGVHFPQIFSAPSGNAVSRTRTRFRDARMLRTTDHGTTSITMLSLMGIGLSMPPRGRGRGGGYMSPKQENLIKIAVFGGFSGFPHLSHSFSFAPSRPPFLQ